MLVLFKPAVWSECWRSYRENMWSVLIDGCVDIAEHVQRTASEAGSSPGSGNSDSFECYECFQSDTDSMSAASTQGTLAARCFIEKAFFSFFL